MQLPQSALCVDVLPPYYYNDFISHNKVPDGCSHPNIRGHPMRIIDYYNFAALLINIILTGIAVYLFLRNHKSAEKAGAGTVSDPADGFLSGYDKYSLLKTISLLLLLMVIIRLL